MIKKTLLSLSCALALGAVAAPAFAASSFYLVVPLAASTQAQEPVEAITVSLAGAALPNATVNQAYSHALQDYLTVTGDPALDKSAARWSLVDGALPAGLVLDSTTGLVVGTPTVATEAAFDATATYKGKQSKGTYTLAVRDIAGQIAFTTSGTYTWTVPAGVYSVSVVAVGGGNGAGNAAASSGTSHFNNSLYAYGSSNSTGGHFAGADGGGRGGNGGTGRVWHLAGYPDDYLGGGGGGAGGYSGDGGAGANQSQKLSSMSGFGGGGVGIYGQGPSGGQSLNTTGTPGSAGSGGGGGGGSGASSTSGEGQPGSAGAKAIKAIGGLYGGGDGGSGSGAGKGGGGLGYKNNIQVTPGQPIPVKVGIGGAVRVIWPGNLRQFPTTRTTDE